MEQIFNWIDQHQDAYKYFQRAWTKGLRSVDLFNNWAVSSFNLGKVDEAINLLHKALRINPDHPESHYNLGIAYSSKGLPEEAQREMLRAMQLQQKITARLIHATTSRSDRGKSLGCVAGMVRVCSRQGDSRISSAAGRAIAR